MDKRVDVVMSVKDHHRNFMACMESLLQQRHLNKIYCVLDGCESTVRETIAAFRSEQIIVIINETCIGLSASLNSAIERAESEYIARMDCDDICSADRFEVQVKFMDMNKSVDVCGMYARGIRSCGNSLVLKRKLLHSELTQNMWREPPFIHPTVMARRDFFKTNPYQAWFLRAQDWELFSRVTKKYTFANIPVVGIDYSIGGGISLSGLKYKFCAGLLACKRTAKLYMIPFVFLDCLKMLFGIALRDFNGK